MAIVESAVNMGVQIAVWVYFLLFPFLFSFFFFLAEPEACGHSWPGIEPTTLQWQCWIFNRLYHRGTPFMKTKDAEMLYWVRVSIVDFSAALKLIMLHVLVIFYCKKKKPIKLSILTIFKCTVLLIFTLLSNRSVNFFILQNWNSVPTKQQLPSLPSLQPLALTILISVSIGLTDYFREVISEITQYLSFCDWLVSLHTMTPGFTHFLALGRFAFFEGWIIFQSRYTPRFVYPFICWWTRGFPPPLRCCN